MAPMPSGIPRIVRPLITSPAYARGLIVTASFAGRMYSGLLSTEFATAVPETSAATEITAATL